MFLSTPAFAAETWFEVRSPHFRVLSNASEKSAQLVAREFEQIRFAFSQTIQGARTESGVPFLIIAPTDEASTKELLPEMWKQKGVKPAGFFSSRWEKEFALIRLDVVRDQSRSQIASAGAQVIYHEYTHSLMHATFRWLPVWFDEGFAEFFGYSRFMEDRIYVGAPSTRAAYARNKTLFPVEKLITMDRTSPDYRDPERTQVFYAQSWALVHFLMVAPEMGRGKRLFQYLSLLEKGVEPKQAFRDAIGDFKDIEGQLLTYVGRPAYGALTLKSLPDADVPLSVRRMDPGQANAELGAFQLWLRETEAARPRIENVVRENPDSAFGHEVMGFVHLNEGRDAEAATEFERALQLDGKLHLSAYYKTILAARTPSKGMENQERFRAALYDVLELNPRFAPPYVQLARSFVREGQFEKALPLARKAEEISPARAGYHTLTASILHALGRDEEAASVARYVADRWQEIDHDEAVELWQKLAPKFRQGTDLTFTTPVRSTQPLRGKITSAQCNKKEKTIDLTIDGKSQTFRMDDKMTGGLSDILWFGGDHFSHCHHLEGLRAAFQYTPSSNPKNPPTLLKFDVYDEDWFSSN